MLGLAKAGSSLSTSVWVTMVATDFFRSAAAELVLERLLDLVAERALGVGHDGIERHLVQDAAGMLAAQEDEADLGPVAVGDHDAVAAAPAGP